MILVLYNPSLAYSDDFLNARSEIKSFESVIFSPLDEEELPSCRLASRLRFEDKDFKFYVIGTRLIDIQTAVNEGGIGIFVPQKDEWEEIKVKEMNTNSKKIVSSVRSAVDFILGRENV